MCAFLNLTYEFFNRHFHEPRFCLFLVDLGQQAAGCQSVCSDHIYRTRFPIPLLWRHNGRSSVSNHLPHGCLLNRLFRHRSKKTSKLRVTGLCAGHSPGTGEFPAQMTSNAENVFIWWRHHVIVLDLNAVFGSAYHTFWKYKNLISVSVAQPSIGSNLPFVTDQSLSLSIALNRN